MVCPDWTALETHTHTRTLRFESFPISNDTQIVSIITRIHVKFRFETHTNTPRLRSSLRKITDEAYWQEFCNYINNKWISKWELEIFCSHHEILNNPYTKETPTCVNYSHPEIKYRCRFSKSDYWLFNTNTIFIYIPSLLIANLGLKYNR